MNGYENLEAGDALGIRVGRDLRPTLRELPFQKGVVMIDVVPAEMRVDAAGVVMLGVMVIQVRMQQRGAERSQRDGYRQPDSGE